MDTKNTNLTVGAPLPVLLRFCFPMILSMVFQQGYNLVDGIISGNVVGTDALAAVGVVHPVTTLLLAVSSGSALGISVRMGQLFGAEDVPRLRTGFTMVSRIFLAASVLIAATGVGLAANIMELLQTPQEIFVLATLYLRIYVAAFPFQCMHQIAAGTLTALGDAKTPLYLLIFSSVTNVALDLVFTLVFGWGLAGIAWATFAAQCFTGTWAVLAARRRMKTGLPPAPGSKFDGRLLREILQLSIPSMLQQMCMALGQMSVQRVVNSYGSFVVAGYTAAFKVNMLAVMSFTVMSSALSVYCAQNMGARKGERLAQGLRAMTLLSVGMAAVIVPVAFFGRTAIVGLFLGADSAEAVACGAEFLYIIAPCYFLVSIKSVADGALRGIGAMGKFMISAFADLAVRVGMAQFLYYHLPANSSVVWWIWPIAWFIGTALSAGFCLWSLFGSGGKRLAPAEGA